MDNSNNSIIQSIRSAVAEEADFERLILFGSRTGDLFTEDSDYDILVSLREESSIKQKRHLSSAIRKKLAMKMIDADVIVKNESEIMSYIDKPGSVVGTALKDGISL